MAEAVAAGGGRAALLAGPVPLPASVRLAAAQRPAGPAALVRRAALHPAPAVRAGHPAAVRPTGDRVPEVHEVLQKYTRPADVSWREGPGEASFCLGLGELAARSRHLDKRKGLEKCTSDVYAWWKTDERERGRHGRDLQLSSCSLVKNGETLDTLLFPSDALRVYTHAREDRVRHKSSSECTVCPCLLCVTMDISLWN